MIISLMMGGRPKLKKEKKNLKKKMKTIEKKKKKNLSKKGEKYDEG